MPTFYFRRWMNANAPAPCTIKLPAAHESRRMAIRRDFNAAHARPAPPRELL
jgi:hypothetical protein